MTAAAPAGQADASILLDRVGRHIAHEPVTERLDRAVDALELAPRNRADHVVGRFDRARSMHREVLPPIRGEQCGHRQGVAVRFVELLQPAFEDGRAQSIALAFGGCLVSDRLA
ncbi:hypothetical protein BH18ACI5_BH18ACI5_04520 [soil metagenome]